MKLLTMTNLYPGADLPRHGIFVEERLRHLVADRSWSAEVVALRPRSRKKAWSAVRHDIPVYYYPVPTLPFVTNWIDPLLWQRTLTPVVAELLRQSSEDVILDAHFLYPDGVAAAIVGSRLNIPVVVTARGSDVNVKCENIVMRQWVRWVCRRIAAVITVSAALKRRLIEFGVDEDMITVLRNGVDLDLFRPSAERNESRAVHSGLSLLSVGHLIQEKGHHIAIEALGDFQDATLTIIGQGPEESALRQLAENVRVADRVRFLGFVPHEEMAGYYGSSDVTVLASIREGMPNVVLESLACGTRVIATDVGGIAEVVTGPAAGFLMANRSTDSLVDALRELQTRPCGPDETRQYAVDNLGWQQVVDRQRRLYEKVAGH